MTLRRFQGFLPSTRPKKGRPFFRVGFENPKHAQNLCPKPLPESTPGGAPSSVPRNAPGSAPISMPVQTPHDQNTGNCWANATLKSVPVTRSFMGCFGCDFGLVLKALLGDYIGVLGERSCGFCSAMMSGNLTNETSFYAQNHRAAADFLMCVATTFHKQNCSTQRANATDCAI